MTDIARYRDLFVHRSDVFAEQSNEGQYHVAGNGHWDNDEKKFIYDELFKLTDDHIAEHLAGFASYGTYIINPAGRVLEDPNTHDVAVDPPNSVKYVVFDLDTYDEAALEHLKWCVPAAIDSLFDPEAETPSRKCLLLESSGGKGYHIWLFLSEPLPAMQVRRWLGWAFWPLWLEAEPREQGWPLLEVFPKQDSVDEGGFGNLVKCPLGKHAVTGNWSKFLEVPGWACYTEAESCNGVVPLEASLVPVPGASDEPAVPAGRSEPRLGQTPFPCIDRALTGDIPRGVREEVLFHTALFFKGNGISRELATAEIKHINSTMEFPISEREIEQQVIKSAYSGRYRAGCGADFLRSFCPGGCPKYGFSKATAAGVLGRSKEGDTVEVEIAAVTTAGGKRRLTLKHPDAENQPTLIAKS